MRLLSIFALLFLISLLLHHGMENPLETEFSLEDQEEIVQAPPEMQEPREDFSILIFKPPYPVGHFDFESDYNFSIIETELKNLIVDKMDDSFKTTNHFCAVGYVLPRDRKNKSAPRKEVVVHWREGKILYRWAGGDPNAAREDPYAARTLTFSPGISLDSDLFGDSKDQLLEQGSASFMENVENVLADCEKHGKRYTIEPFAPPPRGFNIPRTPAVPRPVRPARPAAPPAPLPAAPSDPLPAAPA
ncbi:MAG: hypothetical protein LBT71_09370 [Azoarcus sp.]|jgi:hypothetical protein|nr:hypothetical protein [Azoarcus sp.]